MGYDKVFWKGLGKAAELTLVTTLKYVEEVAMAVAGMDRLQKVRQSPTNIKQQTRGDMRESTVQHLHESIMSRSY
jgi:hypothetical protein